MIAVIVFSTPEQCALSPFHSRPWPTEYGAGRPTKTNSFTDPRVLRMKLLVQPGIFPIPGLWGKNTIPYTGTIAYHRDFLSTTSIGEKQAAVSFLAWVADRFDISVAEGREP